jgi:hypothetical protein
VTFVDRLTKKRFFEKKIENVIGLDLATHLLVEIHVINRHLADRYMANRYLDDRHLPIDI